MRTTIYTLMFTGFVLLSSIAQAENINLKGYKLTFDEEFNRLGVSQNGAGTTWSDIRSEWRYDANSDIGFGKSSFMDKASGFNPFSVGGGALTITGIPYTVRSGYPGSWQSGLLHSKSSFAQTYGYFEMRAKYNNVPGTWPAFWLLPVTTLHPAGRDPTQWQELDIIEQYGANPPGVYSNIHTTQPAPSGGMWNFFSKHPEIASGYHTFGMDWEPSGIRFYVDGVLMGTKPPADDMTGPMYILVDLARDSAYPGSAPSMSMNVDYVRVFSNNPNSVAVRQDQVSAPDGKDPGLYGATVATSSPSDRLTIDLYEMPYQGDCQMLVSVDGVALGGVQTVTGLKASPQTFTVPANLPKGSHSVSVLLVNPSNSSSTDNRTLNITDIKVNGQVRMNSSQQITGASKTFSIKIP